MMYHVSFDIDFKRNTYPGTLIALEGIDGSGKTTQVKRLVHILKQQGQKVFITANPTTGILGRMIRKVLNDQLKLSPVTFQYLYSADRQLQQEKIIPHLEKGEIVITHRYFWSAVAYGLSDKKGKYSNRDMIMAAHCILSWYHQHILPDCTFYLQISTDTAIHRLSSMQKQKDIYERKHSFAKIIAGYDWLLKTFPKEIIIIDAKKPVEKVTEEIMKKLKIGSTNVG